jgi:deazaflavin-dependent oxidoreductase (nitroreductase family)
VARTYRPTLLRKLGNVLMTAALKAGFGPMNTRLLTVKGRKSGREYTTPVNLVHRDDVWYLVAPYGEVSWVRNVRPAGEVTLRKGKHVDLRRIEELHSAEAAPVLADYYRQNAITRPFFDAAPEDGDAWLRETGRHPVFRLSSP